MTTTTTVDKVSLMQSTVERNIQRESEGMNLLMSYKETSCNYSPRMYSQYQLVPWQYRSRDASLHRLKKLNEFFDRTLETLFTACLKSTKYFFIGFWDFSSGNYGSLSSYIAKVYHENQPNHYFQLQSNTEASKTTDISVKSPSLYSQVYQLISEKVTLKASICIKE